MTSPIDKHKIGDATITRVTETVLTTLTPAFLYPDWIPSGLEDHVLRFVLGQPDERRVHAFLNVNVWVVEFGGQVMLIDTGIGNDKERPFSQLFHHLQTPFLERLEVVGVYPENVEHVLFTHLHADHVGWNTRKIDNYWVPTFPKAKYVFPQAERDFYSTPASESRRILFEDSVLPVIEAGQAVTIGEQGGFYFDGIEFLPTPGHSPGHMSISIKSCGEEAIFTGDIAHNPLQVYRPLWNSVFCADADRARTSRSSMLDYAARKKATLFTPHFPETSAGIVTRRRDGYEWRYV
ncbi:MAG TPA: MBL fold metallo-hydrolase [Syntrophorhabdales bacterium]|nr:MBL fold metallo-hydrolase [Syntrophorhabdales bacterium]